MQGHFGWNIKCHYFLGPDTSSLLWGLQQAFWLPQFRGRRKDLNAPTDFTFDREHDQPALFAGSVHLSGTLGEVGRDRVQVIPTGI